MRYADCPTTSVATTIDAPAAAVWALVSDITLPTRFSPELTAAEWLDGARGPALGARFVGRSRHRAVGEWETTSVVTAYEPERCFEWSVGDPDHPSSVWRFTIDDAGDGAGDAGAGVRLEQTFQMGPARSGVNLAIDAMPDKEELIIERRLAEHRANMQANLDGIKELVEGRAG